MPDKKVDLKQFYPAFWPCWIKVARASRWLHHLSQSLCETSVWIIQVFQSYSRMIDFRRLQCRSYQSKRKCVTMLWRKPQSRIPHVTMYKCKCIVQDHSHWHIGLPRTITQCTGRCLAQSVATLVRSTKLLYARPGYYWDGWPYRGSTPGEGNLSQSNQPPRLTQPGHPSIGRRNEYQLAEKRWCSAAGSKGKCGVVCR